MRSNYNTPKFDLYKAELDNLESLAGDYIYGVMVTARKKTQIIESLSQVQDVSFGEEHKDQIIVTNKIMVLKIGERCSQELKNMIEVGDIVSVRELDMNPMVTPYGMSPDKGAPPRPNPHCSIFSFANEQDLVRYQKAEEGPQVLVREHQILAKIKKLR